MLTSLRYPGGEEVQLNLGRVCHATRYPYTSLVPFSRRATVTYLPGSASMYLLSLHSYWHLFDEGEGVHHAPRNAREVRYQWGVHR